jgi:hypothetical protein
MASVDLETRGENETGIEPTPVPRLSWDPSVALIPLGHGWDAEPVVLDWFGDGLPALLVTAGGGSRGRTARLYRPLSDQGAGTFPPRYDAGTLDEALDGLRGLCPIPNGAPNRFDLVALSDEGLVLLRNEGEPQRPMFGPRQSLGIGPDLGLGPCRVVQIVAVDWDGDGLTDLLLGVDRLIGYWPETDRVPIAQRVGFNQKGGHPGYDRNGLWRGQAPQPGLFWLRNVGSLGAPAFELQPELSSEDGPLELALHPAPLAVAWGGGYGMELLVTDACETVRIHRNFGGQRPPVLMEPRTLQSGHGALLLPDDRVAVVAADVDGDRRVELVYGTSDGRVFAIHSGASRDHAKAPAPVLHESPDMWLGGQAVVAAADLDGDGDLDLIVGDAPGRLYLVQDLGSGSDHRYAAPVALEAGGVPFRLDPGPDGMRDGPVGLRLGYSSPAVTDWTGNGRLDLVVGGAGGEILFLRNNGGPNSPRFDAPLPLRCEGAALITPPRVRPAVADWNGDGLADLIALDLQGQLCVYPRIKPYEVGLPVPLVDCLGRTLRLDGGFGQSGRCTLWAGAWTGSGRIDLLVGLPRSNRHVIPALTGQPLGDPEDLPTVLLLENVGHNLLVPRPLRYRDGRPVVAGTEGCSPSGVEARNKETLDLLIGRDDGGLDLILREDLDW